MTHMTEEIQGYGLDCNDASMKDIEFTLTTIEEEEKTEETFAIVTFILACVTLFIVVNIVALSLLRTWFNYH